MDQELAALASQNDRTRFAHPGTDFVATEGSQVIASRSDLQPGERR